MAVQQLTLESLNELDPRILAAFTLEMKRAVIDCMDRPLDKNAREVSIVLKLNPVVDVQTGDCDSANGEFQIKSKVPTRKSKSYNFGVRKNGILTFNADSPDDINQKTLLDSQE